MQRNVPAEKARAQAIHHCCGGGVGIVRIAHEAEVEHQHAGGDAEREQTVDCVSPGLARAAVAHEHADGHGVERFVQYDYQECSKAGEQ